ncbi:MAG: CAP domain-containing protein, partial [Candidatus Roizmanbacteria bacterium]
DITTQRLYELTNAERAKNGLSTLSYNATLSQAAGMKASHMFEHNYWAHNAPDGTTPWYFFKQVGYNYELAGENLARDFEYSDGVVQGWMNSPSHRDNVLKAEYTDIGFAVVNGKLEGEDTTLVVQLFGKPIGTARPAKIVATSQKGEIKKQESPTKVPPTDAPTQEPNPTKGTVIGSIKQGLPQDFSNLTGTSSRIIPSPFARLHHFVTTNIPFLAVVALALALILDMYYAYKLQMLRLGGKNLAHLLFLVTAVVGYVVMTKGVIL